MLSDEAARIASRAEDDDITVAGHTRLPSGTRKRLRRQHWASVSRAPDSDSVAKSLAWSMAQSRNGRAGAPVTSNTVEVTSAG